ncbi:hypothetical protein NO995_13875 [Aestuariibaculum sp. M13]|uniref:hypothetical protein n=1 Tax=Aestuariibaculum sp. M13 TaxID=2967132 RepID=UPI002159EBF9|nr:hypothetical protein [Aestuariibaculum sp. M13]MCR8668774.1 hypothetical protein [Aestuariibaculum sp. M13]
MKLLKSIVLILVLVLFSNCETEKKLKETTITTSELTGIWTLSNDSETDYNIQNVKFNDDFTAEITFNEDSKSKKILGNWNWTLPDKIGGDVSKSTLFILFRKNKNEFQSLLLRVMTSENNKVLTSPKMTLSKS